MHKNVPPHLLLWEEPEIIDFLASKTSSDFFRSELHFLRMIISEINSVFDVGCGCGRLLELFGGLGREVAYTGLDIIERNIATARSLYPNATFVLGDAVTFVPTDRFDLVNATGVFQHEPRFEQLLANMLNLSARYVLFDVKFAEIDGHLIDIEQSFTRNGDHKAYFILLDGAGFLGHLRQLPGIRSISVFGYETPRNDSTVLPETAGPFASVGILLEKGDGPTEETIVLPDRLSAHVTRRGAGR